MWHVLGAGATGCLWGARLARRIPVQLLLRDQIHRSGHMCITVSDGFTPERTRWMQDVSVSDVHADSPIERLLIMTKAHHAVDAVNSLKHRITPDTLAVLMCNGMGIAEQLDSLRSMLLIGSSTHGSYIESREGNRCRCQSASDLQWPMQCSPIHLVSM